MKNFNVVNRVFAGLTLVLSLIVYLMTIAPTVSLWDCGEFITCSYILGIPHPPGAPFFLLIGRLFTLLPLATDIGLRVNIISSLSSAITVMLTYLIIVRFIKQWRGEPKNSNDMLVLVASGFVGALAFAFTDTFWFNAVEAEVYAISMFFTSIILWLILVWHEKSGEPGSERYILFIAYLVGLAIGVHLLMILALPAVFMIVYFKYLEQKQQKMNITNLAIFAGITLVIFAAIYPGVVQWIPRMAGKFGLFSLVLLVLILFSAVVFAVVKKYKIASLALMSFLLIVVGYSTYSLIYIRSNLDPAIDENNPETTELMVKYLNREQYGTWSTFPRRFPGIPPEWQFKRQYPGQDYATYNWSRQMDFMWNYQIKKMYLRYFFWQYAGAGKTIGQDGYIVETLSFNGLFGLPLFLGLIGMIHHYYRNWRHGLSLTAFFILTGIAIVIYLNQEDPQPRERDYVFVGSFFIFSIWIGMGVTALLEMIQEYFHDKKKLGQYLSFATVLVLLLAVPVNLLANNFHDHNRTGNYVAYDYSYNILQTCKKDAILFTNGDNDTFPLWFLQYVYGIRKDVRVVNLSLLNTSWYIKQLKNEEPKVPISLTDEQIDAIDVMPWKETTLSIPVPDKEREQLMADIAEVKQLEPSEVDVPKEIRFTVKPTIMGQGIRVQDYMILNILHANRWQKPVYFAVTVSNQNKLNLDKYLQMDGMCFEVTPAVDNDLMVKNLEKNLTETFQYRGLNNPKVYLNDNIKGLLQNYRAAFLQLAQYDITKGDYDSMVKVLDYMDEVMPDTLIPPPDVRLLIRIGMWYETAGRKDKLLEKAETAVKLDPNNAMAAGTLVQLYNREGMEDKAVKLLEDWVARNPQDDQAQQELEYQKSRMKSALDTLSDTTKTDTN